MFRIRFGLLLCLFPGSALYGGDYRTDQSIRIAGDGVIDSREILLV